MKKIKNLDPSSPESSSYEESISRSISVETVIIRLVKIFSSLILYRMINPAAVATTKVALKLG